MSRRVAALAAASALLGMPPSYGDNPPPPQLPLATCTSRVNDIPGDGVPRFGAENVNGVPVVQDPRGNVPGLDITGVTYRLTDTHVLAFMSVADIPDSFREPDSAYGYIMWFTRGSKVARFEHVYTNTTHAQRGLAPTTGYPTASVGATASGGTVLTGLGGGIDPAKNVAYVYADRKALEEQLGAPLEDGDELTVINARTELWETDGKTAPGVVRRIADQTEAEGAAAVWKVGDDRCFGTSSVTVTNASVQYGDRAVLTATLKNEAGAALPGRKLTVTVPGDPARTLTTDSGGTARLVLDAAPPADTYTVRVTYAGDEYSGPGQGSGTLTVRPEIVRVSKPTVTKSGTARTVMAKFTDDDPRPFVKQAVAWYVNGKKVATFFTDAGGRAFFKRAKPGQRVQARFLGVTNRYTAVSSNTVTV